MAFRMLDTKDPSQAAVVCLEEEPSAKWKVVELTCEFHNGQQLLSGHKVSLLHSGEMTAGKQDNFPPHQYCG